MDKFRITFIALSNSLDIEIKSEKLADEIASDFLFTFAKEVDKKNGNVKIDSLQSNTQDLRIKLDSIVQKYKDIEVKIFQLNSYMKKLDENEFFFFLFDSVLTPEQRQDLYQYLTAKKEGKDYKVLKDQENNLFGLLKENYTIIAFDETTKSRIGEQDKTKRICRFCGRNHIDVTFKKIAHAISEGLGNKKIIGNEECDECNNKFGAGIENDLIFYLDFYRNIYGVKGKNGIPKIKGKNFVLKNEGSGLIEIEHILEDGEIAKTDILGSSTKLVTKNKISEQNIYRALCKYAVSVMDSKDLIDLENTINWINGNISSNETPNIAILTSYTLFANHPKLVIYTRKDPDNPKLPHLVAEFGFVFFRFVYIIPFSKKDSINFSKKENYKPFWNFFKHYSSVPGWSFQNFTNDIKKEMIINLNFEKRKK